MHVPSPPSVVRLVLCVLLVGSVLAPAAFPAGAVPAVDDGNASIVQTTTASLTPDRSGSIDVTVSYGLPESVTRLNTTLPAVDDGATVVGTEGFRRRGTTFVWDGETADPSVRLRIDLPTDRFAGDARGVDTGDWAFAHLPRPCGGCVRWWYRGESPTFRTRSAVAGEGAAFDGMAYLGPYTNVTRETDTERLHLVVPDAAAPRATPERILDVAAASGRQLTAGFEHDRVGIFVFPTRNVTTDRAGQAVGHSFWVRDDRSTDYIGHTWTHEYAHTRFGHFGDEGGDGSSAWLTEALAEYYGALLSLNQGAGSYDLFRRTLTADFYDSDDRSVVLSDRSTWHSDRDPYRKGAHVLAALDAEVRQRTGGERTLQDVLDRRDEYGGLDRYEEFRRAVVGVTDDPALGDWLDRYVTTDALPPMPDDPTLYTMAEDADPDGDGRSNAAEVADGTDPFAADSPPATTAPNATTTAATTRTPTATPATTAATTSPNATTPARTAASTATATPTVTTPTGTAAPTTVGPSGVANRSAAAEATTTAPVMGPTATGAGGGDAVTTATGTAPTTDRTETTWVPTATATEPVTETTTGTGTVPATAATSATETPTSNDGVPGFTRIGALAALAALVGLLGRQE